MITPEKIEEWIREVEERPSSAAEILRLMASRLKNLTRRNEELAAENILLRSEKKVEEYEARISNLEYQLNLLKRQLGGEPVLTSQEQVEPSIPLRTSSILLFNRRGEILRVELDAPLSGPAEAASLELPAPGSEQEDARRDPHLVATGTHEELLLLFSSGRTVSLAVDAIPAQTGLLDWKRAYLEEPRGSEDLAAVVSVGRMSLADSIVQFSRRGCLKKMMRRAFEGFVAAGFVGAGVKINTDQTCGLSLVGKDDRLVLASQEGYVLALDPDRLSYSVEESIRLSPTDHIVSGFPIGQKKLIAFVTQNGKVISREPSWLESSTSSRTRGQALISTERRQAGVRLVGAGAVDEGDWAALLETSGRLSVAPLSELLGRGSVFQGDQHGSLSGFSTFQGPQERS